MVLPKVIPALADLTQDIAGPVPVQLLQDWATGRQDLSAAESLLGPFQIEGTVAASDASGLSRLTREMDLLDVLFLISRPKAVVYALGRAVGGRAIGAWVADNTEMFYPAGLEIDTLVDAMSEAQFRIAERFPVGIGLCLHSGRFYEIGGGLYGNDADRVEYLAEQCAGTGEILLTEEAVRKMKPASLSQLFRRESDPGGLAAGTTYLLQTGRRLSSLREEETDYPHGFPPEFYALLSRFSDAPDKEPLRQQIYQRWLRECVVVFLSRQRATPESESLPALLDNLVISVLMDTVLRETMHAGHHLASSGGGVAILTFEAARQALDFAQALRARFIENGLPVRIGIDTGAVLFFQNPKGASGISGDPVNMASKLAEDLGQAGRIIVTERTLQDLGSIPDSEPFEAVISGIRLRGVLLT